MGAAGREREKERKNKSIKIIYDITFLGCYKISREDVVVFSLEKEPIVVGRIGCSS